MIDIILLNDTADHYSYLGKDEYQDESFDSKNTLTNIRVRTTEEQKGDSLGNVKGGVYTFYFDLENSTPSTYTIDSFKEGDKIVYGTKELRIRTVMPAKSEKPEFIKFTAV